MTVDELRDHWKKKYPYAGIFVYTNTHNTEYYAILQSRTSHIDLAEKSLAKLLIKGEEFLRSGK